ncbi:MAG TPA: FHA domain-containing protein [Polyangiaceae bacterium]|nr:FHA domain-containing protein [Polyangiaceae bacterium]
MEFELGIVCGRCDWYGAMGTAACLSCGSSLVLGPAAVQAPVASPPPSSPLPVPPLPVPPPARAGLTEPPTSLFGADLKPRKAPSSVGIPAVPASQGISALRAQGGDSAVSSSGAFDDQVSSHMAVGERVRDEPSLEELMDQAKNYVCKSCSTPVPMGHKFCGRCGAAVPPETLNARTQFFGQLQVPGKAKLILIRGEGVEGLSYQLNAEQHVVGRNGQLVFPDDPFVSPRHANLFYRGGKLVVRDEGSLNGVFWRVRGTVDIGGGDHFLAGEQLFRLEGPPKANDGPAPDGTYFYTSPKHQTQFKIAQLLEGGAAGMAVCARGTVLQIGREGGDLNFPGDLYMSASHCKLEDNGGKLTLTDLNSRNGTYVRLKTERELGHGDYLFIGRKLLRVEITAS